MLQKETKTCQNCQIEFVIEPDDFVFYAKIQVPPPTWCPECRFQRRLAFRNERAFYKQTCALCGKSVLTLFRPDVPITVYCYECWWSDNWNPLDYGRDYDFSKPFFEQYQALTEKVPLINKWGFDNVNCDYAGHTGYSKNVYLSSSIVKCEDIYFSYSIDKSKNIFDTFISGESELGYENINCHKIYNSTFLINCRNCIDSQFLYDCANCQNCFMSGNLRNKRFYIRNKPYTEQGYKEELNKIVFCSYVSKEKLLKEFQSLRFNSLHRYANIIASRNCTGDDIRNSKNVTKSFLVGDSENIKYCWRIPGNFKDAYDISGSLDSELVYEAVIAADHNYMVRFYIQNRSSKNLDYSSYCSFSDNLFGCVGLKKKSYCVLNKQYSKEEYESLVPKIIEHMNTMPYIDKQGRVYTYGEFFPPELSLFAYNETAAQEYFPLTKNEAIQKGYRWKDDTQRNYQITKKSEDLPDHIKDVSDVITSEIIGCAHNQTCNEQCTQAFKIISDELQFYRRMNLPLPRLCPNCRHYQRLKQRNPLKLWHRKCQCAGQKSENGVYTNTTNHLLHAQNHCPNEFETSYAPERKEIVYCEQCYNAEVV